MKEFRYMKKIIGTKIAGNTLLTALSALLVFHVLVISGSVPSDIIWGGQIDESESNLNAMETISIIVTALFIVFVLIKMDYIRLRRFRWMKNAGIWIVCIYFLINAVGNFTSGVSAENLIFGPITIIFTLLSFRLAIEK